MTQRGGRCSAAFCLKLRGGVLRNPTACDCSGGQRLCERFDVRLLELLAEKRGPGYTVDQLEHISLEIQAGHGLAKILVARCCQPDAEDLYPRSARQLVGLAERLHQLVFRHDGVWFAGRLRRRGEPGVTYGFGNNQRDGVAAEEIEAALQELYDEALARDDWAGLDRRQVARRGAIFLEGFFHAHPFHDGNGRIARLILRVLVSHSRYEVGLFPCDQIGNDGTWHRRYTKGLEHAHRHRRPNAADQYRIEGGHARDPFGKLAAAIEEHIAEREERDYTLTPPPWLKR